MIHQTKKTFLFSTWLAVFSFCILVFAGCNGGAQSGPDSSGSGKNPFDKDASYALGMSVGSNMVSDGISPNLDEFLRGIKDVMDEKKTPRFTEAEALEKTKAAFVAVAEQANEKLKLEEAGFLEENGKKPGIVTTSTGLQYEVLSEGSGPKPLAADTVRVNFTGTFRDGSEFSGSRGTPVDFNLADMGQEIPGWTEGLQLMNVGSKFNLFIPSQLSYGSQEGPFPAYSTMIFEIELLDIVSDQILDIESDQK